LMDWQIDWMTISTLLVAPLRPLITTSITQFMIGDTLLILIEGCGEISSGASVREGWVCPTGKPNLRSERPTLWDLE
jgi:hypothetical protein